MSLLEMVIKRMGLSVDLKLELGNQMLLIPSLPLECMVCLLFPVGAVLRMQP